MVRILAADPAALPEAPQKFAVLELPGGDVMVRWADSLTAFARYGTIALADLGRERAEFCAAIATARLGPCGAAVANR
jgi:hypothetical protein